MSNTNTGGPAFPQAGGLAQVTSNLNVQGMTLRDYFAAKAMNAYWNDPSVLELINTPENVAGWAYEMADAMLEARDAS
jgi:hypothetical protein